MMSNVFRVVQLTVLYIFMSYVPFDIKQRMTSNDEYDLKTSRTARNLIKKITERNTNPPNSQCSDGAHTLLGTV